MNITTSMWAVSHKWKPVFHQLLSPKKIAKLKTCEWHYISKTPFGIIFKEKYLNLPFGNIISEFSIYVSQDGKKFKFFKMESKF